MKEFRSKAGLEILIPLFAISMGVVLIPIIAGAPIAAIITLMAIILPTIAFVLYTLFDTSYRINNEQLVIKCGFFYKSALDISEIKSITLTRNIGASPAASLDRLELKYGKWNSVVISPEDKAGFVNELLKINPNIKTAF